MRHLTLFVTVIVLGIAAAACESPPPILEEGKWTGFLIPLDNGGERSELYYRVSYPESELAILIGMADFESRSARNIQLTADSLHFVFDDPGVGVPVTCAFGLQSNGVYEGPCTDTAGKSAYVTMRPPSPFEGQEA